MKKEYEYSDSARKARSERKKGNKGKGNKHSISVHNGNIVSDGGKHLPPSDFEVVFKWVPVETARVSPGENHTIFREYNRQRERMLKETVYNPDGTENKEGIARLRQAGLNEEDIFEMVGKKGRLPNGYNYHHLFPRAMSGAFKEGPVRFGKDMLTSIHDWRCMMALPCAHNLCDIHKKVHDAMNERNGYVDQKEVGKKEIYYYAMPLTAEEYELYKTNPKALKEELLIVSGSSYRTIDQRENGAKSKTTKKGNKHSKTLDSADIAKIKAARDGR